MDLATECITNEFTDGYNPSAFHRSLVERHTHRRSSRRIKSVGLSSITKKYLLYICHNHRRNKSVGNVSVGSFFLARNFHL